MRGGQNHKFKIKTIRKCFDLQNKENHRFSNLKKQVFQMRKFFLKKITFAILSFKEKKIDGLFKIKF
jgi:hypothetical protein